MTLLVRNEIDIIEQNIQFHLNNGIDFIIVTDNNSTDGTLELLKRYESYGLLFLIEEPEDTYAQSKWVTRMARLACDKHNADWVIHNDADEFWWTDKNDLKSILTLVPDNIDVLEVERYNFIRSSNTDLFSFSNMIYKHVRSLNTLGSDLPPKIIHRNIKNISIGQGNHNVISSEDLNISRLGKIEIFHFPLRTYKQYESKIRLGGAAYKRNKELSTKVGITWRKSYDKYISGNLRQVFDSYLPNETELLEQISRGATLKDKRLYNWMNKHYRPIRTSFITRMKYRIRAKFLNNIILKKLLDYNY